ncbi:MAG: hypothetical protein IKI64_08020 [Clostridia bacterium]|nr:hypothetical protein [Clostridia bacterium]
MLKKRSIVIALILSALTIGAAFIYVNYIYPKIIAPAETYSQARSLYNEGNYMQAALKLGSIPGYSDSRKLASQAWKLAGDSAYNEGKFDMASACYIKAGSKEEDMARMDECYLRLAENAFLNGMVSRGEIYLNCVSNAEGNEKKKDDVRITAAKLAINAGLDEANIDQAIDRFEACSENANGEIKDILLGWGKTALENFDMESANTLFAAAKRFCDEEQLTALIETINNEWTEAGKRALARGMDAFAQKCFDISGYVPQLENAEEVYQEALKLYANRSLFEALTRFRRLGDYKDSRTMASAIAAVVRSAPKAGAEQAYAMLNADGTVELFGDEWDADVSEWANIKQIAVGKLPFIVGLTDVGTVLASGKNTNGCLDVGSWNDVIDIACGSSHTIGLRSDGTVLFTGSEMAGRTGVSTWRGISAIAAGKDACYGLMQNGIVFAAGDNSYGQCDVSSWENITMVSGGTQHAVGLKKDGTVVACGDNSYGQCDVSHWSDIVFVSAGAYHTVGLRADGTLVACGRNDSGECAISSFRSVAAVAAGSSYTVLILENGTMRVIGRTNG